MIEGKEHNASSPKLLRIWKLRDFWDYIGLSIWINLYWV